MNNQHTANQGNINESSENEMTDHMNEIIRERNPLSVCGLYCGACYHYRASFPDGEHIIREWIREGMNAEDFTCDGCRSKRLYVHLGCSECDIRSCADARSIIHCGECREFPCQRLEEFRTDGRPHHRDVVHNCMEINRTGSENWLRDQDNRWRCTCGRSHSWYEQRCKKCGKELNSYHLK